MTACAACPHQPSRVLLSNTTTTVMAVIAAMTFSASGAAPTPIYQIYQETLALTPFTLTIIFAAYVLSLLFALLTFGSISDYIGRRPAILAALSLNVMAMIIFVMADSAVALIAARSVQGFATGLATTALGAAILDISRNRGPILNSVTAFGGLTVGSLGGAALVTFAPDPTQLVYFALLATSALEALVLWHMPETAEPKSGVLASLLPQLSVPVQARTALLMLTPVTIASWALGGFYFSLMPSLVRVATGARLPFVGGLVVAALTFSAALAVLSSRKLAAGRTLLLSIPALAAGVAITLIGAHAQLVTLMLIGTIMSGSGFGAAFSATIRAVMPLAQAHERASLLAAFYIVGYVAFSLPAVLAGFSAASIGLRLAADIYGTIVILLALASLVAASLFRDAAKQPN